MFIFNAGVRGQSTIGPGPTLAFIKQFANDFCGTEPTKPEQLRGTTNHIELSASAKAGLSKLFKNLVDVGVDLSGKVTQSQYQGVLQADIPKIQADKLNCIIIIYNSLVERLLDKQTRELSFTIKRTLHHLNMADAPVRVGNSVLRPFFIQSPDYQAKSNGIEIKVWGIKIGGRALTTTVSFTLSTPGESSLSFEADESTHVQLSTQTCRSIEVSVLSVSYIPTEAVRNRNPTPAIPLRASTGELICLDSQQACLVNIELKARCKIDA